MNILTPRGYVSGAWKLHTSRAEWVADLFTIFYCKFQSLESLRIRNNRAACCRESLIQSKETFFIPCLSGTLVHRCKKNVDPNNKKNLKERVFYENNKNFFIKTLNKKHWWQIHTIIQTKWKKFSSKITVLVFMTTSDSFVLRQRISYCCRVKSIIHSFIPAISIAPLKPTTTQRRSRLQHGYWSEFHAEAHRQLQVKDLPKVPTWRLVRESNPRPSGWKLSTQPRRHHVQLSLESRFIPEFNKSSRIKNGY